MGFGIYIHFPYCVRKCGYCDFSSFGEDKWPKSFDGYVDRLIQESNYYVSAEGREKIEDFMTKNAELVQGKNIGKYQPIGFQSLYPNLIDTVYFGGGTPSLMKESQIRKILDFFKPFLKEDAEITMECNPGTVTMESLKAVREAGVNRLSIGLQAAQDRLLKRLGRIHSFKDFLDTVEWAKQAGFLNISADVMFGLPDQDLKDWKETIETILHCGVQHISAYGLKIEEDTAFDRMVLEGTLVLPEVELEREMYHKACEIFEMNGFHQYEISNFSRPGMESRHNLNYWESGDYIGIGLNSHSKLGDVRFWNKSSLMEYEDALKDKLLPMEGFEILDLEERIFERIILSLRLNKGLNLSAFEEEFGKDRRAEIEPLLKKNEEKGYLVRALEDEEWIRFTKKGRDLSNQVYLDFLK